MRPEGEEPVGFRALSLLKFGTIYEGFLESRVLSDFTNYEEKTPPDSFS